jgi:hypothetical protein
MRPLRVFVVTLVVVWAGAQQAVAAPRWLSRHRGTTTVRLSGETRLTLSKGCHQLPVGEGQAWRVRLQQDAHLVTRTAARLQLRDGKVKVEDASLRTRLSGATLENPMAVVRGLVKGAPSTGLRGVIGRQVRRLADGQLGYTPKLYTLEQASANPDRLQVGLEGTLHVGSSIDRPHRWAETYSRDQARRWVSRTFGGSGDTRAQLAAILDRLAPAERKLVVGAVNAQLEATGTATASLRAGQHTLPPGCRIQISDGTRASVRLELRGSTSAGKLQLQTATANVELSKPVAVSRPLSALHALKGRGPGKGPFARLGRAFRGAVDRVASVEVTGLELQRAGDARKTNVRLSGTLSLFNRWRLKLQRSVSLKDGNLGAGAAPVMTGLLGAAEGRLDAKLHAGDTSLTLTTTPTLTFGERGSVQLTAPAELRTPNMRGSYTVEGTHRLR